jgi:hypothetical protein
MASATLPWDDPGPAERDERGLVVIGADLRDRMEF